MKPKNEQELFGLIFYVAKSASRELLNRLGIVPPWGMAVLPRDFSTKTVFPGDRLPGVGFSELLSEVVRDLRKVLDEIPELPAAAIICTVESGKARGLVVQVETPEASSTFFFAYEKKFLRGWVFEAPEFVEEQFADSVYPIAP